jgi:DUF1365 family protein
MHSRIYRGEVVHRRTGAVEHAFTYPVTFFAFDLAELDALPRLCPLFGRNGRAAVLTLRDWDYLRGERRPIGEQLAHFLPPPAPGEHTLLVTSPRLFGYAFNPVNFYLRLRDDRLTAALAEVNNTFGDRHVYPLPVLQEGPGRHSWTARHAKEFHVSPFNDMAGEYRFHFQVSGDRLFLGVDLHRGGACVMKTWIQGEGRPLSGGRILRHALLRPFDTALNSFPRILWQAAVLYFRKRLPVFRRPGPLSPRTLVDRDRPEGGRAEL